MRPLSKFIIAAHIVKSKKWPEGFMFDTRWVEVYNQVSLGPIKE
jgi:hypothetical protein